VSKAPHASVSVDRTVCQSTGYCEHLLPQVFRVGAEGHAEVLREVVTEEELELAREAEDICPTRAILVELGRPGG
jgi:ferredoxin